MSIIRQQAFCNKNQRFLKGGLHCHTTRSDGKGNPEEVIKKHDENGYDFLALTDHRIYNYKNYAPDTNVLIIPGTEYDATFFTDTKAFRCFHTVCIGDTRENGNGFEQDRTFERIPVKDQFEYQQRLDMIHANNNLTFYCHPEWSSTPVRYFENLQGNFALEIWNSGCVMDNDIDKDAYGWDELLQQGKRLFGVAVDDGHAMNQHCNGWVMVNSEKNVTSILNALSEGRFYSSCGPEIYDFYVENGMAHIECSKAKMIRFYRYCYPVIPVRAGNELLSHAEYSCCEPTDDGKAYIRATVTDENGKMAWTNPIFLD